MSGAAGNTSGNGPSPQDQQTNRIADINPADIESMQFLEGSAASAIYGSKSSRRRDSDHDQAWGVRQAGVQRHPARRNLRSEQHAARAPVQPRTGPGGQHQPGRPAYAGEIAENYNECGGFCDFQNQLYGQQGPSYETDLSVSGALPSTEYFVSGLTKYDNGAEINTGYQKQSIRTNIVQHIAPTLTASANVAYSASLARRGVNGNDNWASLGRQHSYTPSYFDMNKQNPDGSYVRNPYGVANAFDDARRILTPENVTVLPPAVTSTSSRSRPGPRASSSFSRPVPTTRFRRTSSMRRPTCRSRRRR